MNDISQCKVIQVAEEAPKIEFSPNWAPNAMFVHLNDRFKAVMRVIAKDQLFSAYPNVRWFELPNGVDPRKITKDNPKLYIQFYWIPGEIVHDMYWNFRSVTYVPGSNNSHAERSLEWILSACAYYRYEVMYPEGYLIAVVTEKMNGKHSIVDYYDARGRIVKTEFIGDRGCFGSKGVTNHYVFEGDELVRFYQLIHRPGGDEKMERYSR